MSEPPNDWQPLHPDALERPLETYDQLRRRCPVAYSTELGWTPLRHDDTMTVLLDHETYSNEVSEHLSVPNGMDPPSHTRYRQLIEPYLAPERVEGFAARFRDIARALLQELGPGEHDLMAGLGHPFAARVQCAFMGWPDELHGQLRRWIADNQTATRRHDRHRLARLASDFDRLIRGQLSARRNAPEPPQDTTTQLLNEQVAGRPLTDEELVSLIRNWTAGELGTIAASVGILGVHLARDPELQHELRRGTRALTPVIDELLRLDGPLVANRRRTTRATTLGGRQLEPGDRVTILWPAANRDEAVFGLERIDPDRHAGDNLLYGAGVHVCPGAPLARRELGILVEELLDATSEVAVAREPTRAHYPAGGYEVVPVRLR
jgi:cytochrome P450